MKSALALAGLLTLSACATPAPQIQVRELKVPVPVACVDSSKVPAEPGQITLDKDARIAADQASAQAKDLRVWGRSLNALIQPCLRP